MRCRCRASSLLSFVLLLAGCESPPPSRTDAREPAAKPQDEKLAGGYDAGVMAQRIGESMSQLSPEDRKAAEAQKFCPVAVEFDKDGKPVSGFLGSIGKPVKIVIEDQPVFIMCPSCTDKFKGNTDKYMAVVAKIRVSQQSKTGAEN